MIASHDWRAANPTGRVWYLVAMGTNEFSRRTFLAASGAAPAAGAASREPVVAPTYPQVEA